MYAAIWHALPGPWPVRLLIALALAAGVTSALIFHIYPWVMQEWFPTPDPVLGAAGLSPTPHPAAPMTSISAVPAEDLV